MLITIQRAYTAETSEGSQTELDKFTRLIRGDLERGEDAHFPPLVNPLMRSYSVRDMIRLGQPKEARHQQSLPGLNLGFVKRAWVAPLVRNEKVAGSNPVGSTKPPPGIQIAVLSLPSSVNCRTSCR